jgi:hypothetical protein
MGAAPNYLRTLLISVIVLLATVGTFNLLVDPYGLFRVGSVEGFNRIKSQAGQRAGTYKRVAVARMHPNALILGNSRAEIGFDPASSAWPSSARPVFNLALPGSSIDSALEEFKHVLGFATPTLVVLGLDFLDFRVDPAARYAPEPKADRKAWLRERVTALLSVSALADSLATMKAQRDPYSTSLDDSGFNPMHDYVGIARREGYFAMFRQRDQENARSYAHGGKTIHLADGRPAPEFAALDDFMDIARRHRIQLRLVVYPVHAHTLILFHRAGLWPAFDEWKRELVKRIGAGPDVDLWDFSGFSVYSEEAVPPPGDIRSQMRWYWEAGHFKSALGDVILTNIFNSSGEPAWGRRLTTDNLDDHLRAQQAALYDYERDHAAEVNELADLIGEAAATTGLH